MDQIKISVQIVYGLILWAALLTMLLIINFLQMFTALLLPISRPAVRKINRFFANTWWGSCALTMEYLQGMKFEFTGDFLPLNENAIVIANHQNMSDIPVLFALAKSKRTLGDMKWFVKMPIKYIPAIGWGMIFLDCIFVNRIWSDDKDKIIKTFRNITSNHVPVWIMTFPEGTRLTPSKLAASQKFAGQKGLPVPQATLIPRTKGFVATVEGLRNHAVAVYDVTIIYHDLRVAKLWFLVTGRIKSVTLHVNRTLISDLPEDREGLANWLTHTFESKDKMLTRYYESHPSL